MKRRLFCLLVQLNCMELEIKANTFKAPAFTIRRRHHHHPIADPQEIKQIKASQTFAKPPTNRKSKANLMFLCHFLRKIAFVALESFRIHSMPNVEHYFELFFGSLHFIRFQIKNELGTEMGREKAHNSTSNASHTNFKSRTANRAKCVFYHVITCNFLRFQSQMPLIIRFDWPPTKCVYRFMRASSSNLYTSRSCFVVVPKIENWPLNGNKRAYATHTITNFLHRIFYRFANRQIHNFPMYNNNRPPDDNDSSESTHFGGGAAGDRLFFCFFFSVSLSAPSPIGKFGEFICERERERE